MFVPPDWLKYIFGWLKIPANYFLPILVASAFGLFASDDLLRFLGIAGWRIEGKPYLGSVFIISAAIVGCHSGALVVQWLVPKYKYALIVWGTHKRLKRLTGEEQQLLAGYLKKETRVRNFQMDNGVVPPASQ